MKRIVCAAVAASVIVGAGVVPAAAASVDIGQAIGGSMQEVINGVVMALITVAVGWVGKIFHDKLNIDIEARHREALTAFLQRQASGLVAAGAVKLEGVKVEVKNEALAAAANTALRMIPDVLKFFKLTPDRLQSMIVDLLPKQPAVAAAAAVALDVQNPATPSTTAPPVVAVAAPAGK